MKGVFVTKGRRLAEDNSTFDIIITEHTSTKIKIDLKFSDPNQISRGNTFDSLKVEVKSLSLFKSALTHKSISLASFENGEPILTKSISYQISNPEAAAAADSLAETGGRSFDYVTSGNFLVIIIVGYSAS